MIGITTDPNTGQQQLTFANGSSSPLPVNPGFYISGSACGAGKTKVIAQIAQRYSGEGVLIIVSTRKAADEIGAKIPWGFILHTDNLANLEQYRNSPTSLSSNRVLIITSPRAIIDPCELFLSYGLNGKRRWVLIDELITFYPDPFEVPEKVKDALTYVDMTKVHKGSILVGDTVMGKKHFYKHTYSKKEEMEAAYRLSKDKIFTGKSELVKFKEGKILEHVTSKGCLYKSELDEWMRSQGMAKNTAQSIYSDMVKSMELVKVTEHLTNKVVVGIPSAISNMLSESQPDRYRMK